MTAWITMSNAGWTLHRMGTSRFLCAVRGDSVVELNTTNRTDGWVELYLRALKQPNREALTKPVAA